MTKLEILNCPESIQGSEEEWGIECSPHAPHTAIFVSCNNQQAQTAPVPTPPNIHSPQHHANDSSGDDTENKRNLARGKVTDPASPFPHRPATPTLSPNVVVELIGPTVHTGETWTVYRGQLSTTEGSRSVILKFAPASAHEHALQEHDNLVRANGTEPSLNIPLCYGLFWNSTLDESIITSEGLVEIYGHPYDCGSFVMICQDVGQGIEEWIDLDESCKSNMVSLIKSFSDARIYVEPSLQSHHFCMHGDTGRVFFVDPFEAEWLEDSEDNRPFFECQVLLIQNYLMISMMIPYVTQKSGDTTWPCQTFEPLKLEDVLPLQESHPALETEGIADLRIVDQAP